MKATFSMIAIFSMCNAFAGALDNWHWRNPLPTASSLRDVAFGGDQFVAVGNGGAIVTSTDGENWTARSSGSQAFLFRIAHGDNMFLAHGFEGTNGVVLTSPDGLTWTLSIAPTAADLYDVTYAQRMFVGVGHSVLLNREIMPLIATSTDGRNWTPQKSVPTQGLKDLSGITYGNGTFVAVGDYGLIVTSTDGSNWTESGSGTGLHLHGVAFGDGLFVAVGGASGISVVLTSTDGVAWATAWSLVTRTAPKPLLDLQLVAVNYGNGLFVACGEGQAVLTSSDGLTWTDYDLGTKRFLESMAYGNRHHAAVGFWSTVGGVTSGPIVSSPDGMTWTDRTSGVLTVANRGLAFGNGTYVAAGWNGKILASTNGTSWTQTAELGALADFFGAGYGNGVLLAVGIELILSGTAGATYRIEYSDELGAGMSWGLLTSIFITKGSAIFTDAQAPATSQRFYRAALLP